MDIKECMDFVDSYTKSGGRITDLSRARELAERIGSPEKRLKFVHIAGTNGKGSTLEYISNALIDAGYRTGQFTSPYVLRYSDRIRINGQEIDEKSLCEMAERVKSAVGDKPYSQFEITMAIALLWFEREKCDVVVFETGIGGLLDSTNIIPPPLVSVITSISLDHTAILGKTVEEIAEQKAGIIKGGSAVVLAEDNPDSVKELVRKKAESVGAEFVEPEPCRPYGDGGMFSSFYYRGVRLRPSMPGVHQLYNAQTAITVCLYLRSKGFEVSDGSIIRAVENTQVRARLQYIDGEPPVLVDGGHNPAGVAALTMMLMYLSSRGKKIFAVMGMVDSKDYAECVKSVAGCADAVYAVEGFAPNSVPAETIADIASFYTETGTGSLAECAAKAKERALAENGVAVICGSLYLASEYLNSELRD
ncbi:folylpolyglutamate synthase/dihydrofolate synthase family protein [uncultured Ruminococcus sp.]|uniref:bifunctional folylpolyglutamate synthase/dihydrofolate synthase n=1 Tax=uncultured Ruminococcus sp. TaxID=165186 RepID=UPI00261A7C3B|nr:folylpolyglutamate synthase/dihydrofolate synthase family protein [uncultured Ruminococcus sp.]